MDIFFIYSVTFFMLLFGIIYLDTKLIKLISACYNLEETLYLSRHNLIYFKMRKHFSDSESNTGSC